MAFSDYIKAALAKESGPHPERAYDPGPPPLEMLCVGAYLLRCCETGTHPTYTGATAAGCGLKAGVLLDYLRDARDLGWVTEGHRRNEAIVATAEGLEELGALRTLWIEAGRPEWNGRAGYVCPPYSATLVLKK